MKRLIIKNFGPIASAELDLKQLNLIIGPQSSGKSCLLKTACYCAWVEKRIELLQSGDAFMEGDTFISRLMSYHHEEGYARTDTFISYETDYLKFSYSASTGFTWQWKDKRWEWRRTKISYIPAERMLVGVVPNWYKIDLGKTNLQEFLSDWEDARKSVKEEKDILNIGVKYRFDTSNKSDRIIVEGGPTLDISETSSGVQSLVPMFLQIDYIVSEQYRSKGIESIERRIERSHLQDQIAETHSDASIDNYVYTDHCDIFLEEPEVNLFPVAQCDLVSWLFDKVLENQRHNLFIATHSPYILTAFLERNYDLNLFLINEQPSGVIIDTASDEDIQRIYDHGIDAFDLFERRTL